MNASTSSDPVVRLHRVTKAFTGPGVSTQALSDVSLEVQSGEFVAIVGSSGSGKSTLLNVMGLIESADAGECWVDGIAAHAVSEADRAALRSRVFGYVFQSFHLVDTLTVERNVEMALRYRKLSAEERRQRVAQTLERLEISHRARHYPSQLSGGQQQRVAIARALVASPKVILADEPTGNLDSSTSREVMQLLLRLHSQGTALVVVTHSGEVAAHAERRVEMRDGMMNEQAQG